VVIKEEYVALTGDHISAVLLSQIEYWTMRTHDFDRFLKEEKTRAKVDGKEVSIPLMHGWVYKTAEDLSAETMMGLSASTIRVRLKKLIEKGWISERNNPEHLWDRTKQYRFNARAVAASLKRLGYLMEGWTFEHEGLKPGKGHGSAIADFEDGTSKTEIGNAAAEDRSSKFEDRTCENCGAIPEITTEITDRDLQQRIKYFDHSNGVADEPDASKSVVENQPETQVEKQKEEPVPAVAEIMNYAASKGIKVPEDCARDLLSAAGSVERAITAVDRAAASALSKVRRGEQIHNPAGLLFKALGFNSGARLDLKNLDSARKKRLAEKEKKYKDIYLS
jgi:hypothetical protein